MGRWGRCQHLHDRLLWGVINLNDWSRSYHTSVTGSNRKCTRKTSRSTGWPALYRYQLAEQVSLLAKLVAVQAQRASQPACQAGCCTRPASRSACFLGWYLYQPSKQVSLLAGLVSVPAKQAGQPACWPGTTTSLASRSTGLPRWCLYQANVQVSLLAGLVCFLAWWAGQLACRASR
jgi:uncharacterized membrane protein (UPF0136 family)